MNSFNYLRAIFFFAVILSWCCTLRGYVVTLKFVPVVNTPCGASFTQEIYRLLNLSCDSKFRDNVSVVVMSNGRFISERSPHRSIYIFRIQGEIPFFRGVKGLVLSLLLGVFTPVPTEYHARVTGVNAALFVANLHYLKSMKRQHQLS